MATRPAYSRLLQWPGQWFTSPRKRASAKARTDHLGLSALDLDAATDEHKKPAIPSSSDVIPQSLRVSKQTITSAIEKHQHAARFRLDALADAFFEPLQELLGNKRYMLSEDKTSSLDCLALSYLALALFPQVPHKWLAETMKARYPTLCSYVKRLSEEFFGGPVQVEDALIGSDDESRIDNPQAEGWHDSKKLPWRKPAGRGVRDAGSTFLTGILDSIPFAERLRRDPICFHSANTESAPSNSAGTSSLQSIMMPSALALGSMAAAVGGYLLYSNGLGEPSPQRSNLSQMGEAGAMLGVGMFGHNATVPDEGQRTGRVPVGLEVDVEVDETAIR